MLDIIRSGEEKAVKFALEGRLDTATVPKFEAELKGSLDSASSLILDLEKLEYISSAGLRVLIMAQKAMKKQGGMKLVHVNETVREILEVTGFSDILTIEV